MVWKIRLFEWKLSAIFTIFYQFRNASNYIGVWVLDTKIKKGPRSFAKQIFSRQIFLLYFGKGNFGGKNFNLKKKWIYFAKEVFSIKKLLLVVISHNAAKKKLESLIKKSLNFPSQKPQYPLKNWFLIKNK